MSCSAHRNGFAVSPRRKSDIYDLAARFRAPFRPLMKGGDKLPIDLVYELLPEFLPGFRLEVCERHEMGDDHGQTDPSDRLIKLRIDVYDGMCRGSGRDRFTAAHELGHLMLHGQVPVYSRAGWGSTTPIYMNSEWQADNFASALLIDELILPSCRTVDEVQSRFGVSAAAAAARFKK